MKMKQYKEIIIRVLLSLLMLSGCEGSTHWIVTEEGKIQAQTDSFFSLKCPYNLMTFLQQEQRIVLLQQLKQQLIQHKQVLDSHEDNDTDLEGEFLRTNEDCLEAGKQLVDMDLYVSSILTPQHKNIPIQDYTIPPDHSPYTTANHLDCSSYFPLEYSIHAFEHLAGVSNRHNLTSLREADLLEQLPFMADEEYVCYLKHSLQQNVSSWLHYSMGGFHWRLHGNSSQAVECLRRALHFAPRHYKDIPLVSLANLLHKHHLSKEAAVLLHSALHIDPSQATTHYALANVYASLSEVNRSLLCYENALVLDRLHLTQARVRRRAVLCHMKLEALLENNHRKLQNQLESLRRYQEKHAEWQRLQRRVMMEQVSEEHMVDNLLFYQQFKMGLHQRNKYYGDHHHHHHFNKRNNHIKLTNNDKDNKNNNKKNRQEGNGDDGGIGDDGDDGGDGDDDDTLLHHSLFEDQMASSSGVPESSSQFGDWPSRGECERNIEHYPLWSEFQTVFLPPSRRGFDVMTYLGAGQGLQTAESHPFPWYPPTCQPLPPPSPSSSSSSSSSATSASFDILKSYEYLSVQNKALLRLKLEDTAMKEVLLGWVERGSEVTMEEVGQRILTALKQGTGPAWLLYNVAGLYWRVLGEPLQAVQCINNALVTAPQEFKHFALVNLANVLYKIGKVKDALKVMKDVLAINPHEPESLLLTGNLCAALGSIDEAVMWYQRGLHQDASNHQALYNLRLVLCLKKFHRGNTRYQQRPSEGSEGRTGKDGNHSNRRRGAEAAAAYEDVAAGGDDHKPFPRNNYYDDLATDDASIKKTSRFFRTRLDGVTEEEDEEARMKLPEDMRNAQQIGLLELCQKIVQNPDKKRVKLINPSSGQEAFVEQYFCKQLLSNQGKKGTCIIKSTNHHTLSPCDVDPFTDFPQFSSEEGGGDAD